MDNIEKRKKIYLSTVIILFCLLTIMFLTNLIKVNKNIKNDSRPIAVVGDITVYESDLKNRLNSFGQNGNVKIEDLPENVLKAMVLEVVVNNKIEQEAKKLKYCKDKTINKLVKEYKKELIKEKYLTDNIYSKVTDEDVKKEYDLMVKELEHKEERKIKHILVETKDEIDRVRRGVLRTGNFEKIASEKSIDVVSGQNGGDIGYVLKEELVPEFGDVAFILKVGEISKPIQTQYGWHIIKVEDVRQAQILPFEQVKENIKQRLQQQAIQDYLVLLTKDANVEFKIDIKNPNNNNSESISQTEIVEN